MKKKQNKITIDPFKGTCTCDWFKKFGRCWHVGNVLGAIKEILSK